MAKLLVLIGLLLLTKVASATNVVATCGSITNAQERALGYLKDLHPEISPSRFIFQRCFAGYTPLVDGVPNHQSIIAVTFYDRDGVKTIKAKRYRCEVYSITYIVVLKQDGSLLRIQEHRLTDDEIEQALHYRPD